MDLRTGTRVGSYEILGPLSARGMGEVYRALDSRLGREVAIKVLPAAVSQDPQRRARLEREARLLAGLNHPGISAIYGVEDTPAGRFLVLEMVPGVTLAQRIARGPVPIAEALSIARQIADAVAYAHANSVVHRDLKPANVKITPNGKVKELDFGIAKALSPDLGSFSSDASTVTPADTATGAIIGTPDYMSPEQARAQEADRRTDIWSLGCILYEMLTGQRAFQAQTVADTLAAVLSRYPNWDALPAGTPAQVRALLRPCLQRDRDQRVHEMADVRIEIDDALASTASSEGPAAAIKAGKRLTPIEIAALVVVVLGSLLNVLVLYTSVPLMAAIWASYELTLPLPLRIYIAASLIVGRLAPVFLILGAIVWIWLRRTGRSFPPRLRASIVVGVAAVGGLVTILGPYTVGRAGLLQTVQLSMGARAPDQILDRNLATLYLAAGQPELAVALLELRVTPGMFRWNTFNAPGMSFALAESYRIKGDLANAKAMDQKAQEAATKFDEETTQSLVREQASFQQQFGPDFVNWLPSTADLRKLPDMIRSVSQQRLDQMAVSK